MNTIDQYNFSGHKALIRVDFNVPLDEKFSITDNTRIRAAIPTIKKILNVGGSAILMSHLGRPKNGYEKKYSLVHLVKPLSKLLGKPVQFADDCIGEKAQKLAVYLQPGEILLLENLRFYPEEEQGDETFSKKLSELGTFYVNDAFGTAHRAHASTTVIARFFPERKCFGYLMSRELKNIDDVLNKAQKPFTAIIGGAKVSAKIMILRQLIKKANNIIIGGGMAFTFIKAKGGRTGKSLLEENKLEAAEKILSEALARDVNIFLPVDTVTADTFSNDAEKQICGADNIPDGRMGLDIGPETEKIFSEIIMNSKTILWNGPMGVFEMSNYEHGTKTIATAIAAATARSAYTLIGGGDSVAAINKYNLAEKVSYVSTGGGALLEYIEKGTLPGVEAMKQGYETAYSTRSQDV